MRIGMPVLLSTAAGLLAVTLFLRGPVVAAPPVAEAAAPKPVAVAPSTPDEAKPRVQLALLLDVSGSMDGLIEQAKGQLWNIVNEFSRVKRNGVRPELELALFTYGDSNGAREMKLQQPFTTNLDLVSEKLFALSTSGGFEPAGEVIHRAVNELDWVKGGDAMKIIFIAGNESFEQGEVPWRTAIREAKERHISVNTIHCGTRQAGVGDGWLEAAQFAGGRYLVIDQNARVVDLEVAAPQDKELADLGVKLNATYVAYGAHGTEGQQRQMAQDRNSSGISTSNMASRAATKSSAYYDNSGWDLLDATKKRGVKLEEVRAEDLPKEMRGLDEAGRRAYLEEKAKARTDLQARIAKLSQEREEFIRAERARRSKAAATKDASALDDAIVEAVKAEAKKNAFVLE